MRTPTPKEEARAKGCTATSYMDNLSYCGQSTEAQLRIKCTADRQSYCDVCKLCRWPEEQRTCPQFVLSVELEEFCAAEEAKSRRPI
jgi:hypothetical protein